MFQISFNLFYTDLFDQYAFFILNHKYLCQSTVVTQQKLLMTLFKLNCGQKIRKVTLKNLKIGKLCIGSTTSSFHELVVMKFDSKLN